MVIQIPLSQGKFALVDDEDYERVAAAGKWYAARHRNTFYAARKVRLQDGSRGTLKLHALLTGYALTDHRNGDGLDNRRVNLREATNVKNQRNRRLKPGTLSGFKGVTWDRRRGKWRAQITVDRRRLWLGYYADPVAAARAYDDAAREHFGEFAHPNFP